MKLASIFILLHLPFSFCAWAEVWERFWVLSCEFSPEVEKHLNISRSRAKRSLEFEDLDFDNPEELFDYLYPLADLSPEDLAKEARSASSSNTAYIWLTDLCRLWLAECNSRAGKARDKDMDNEDLTDEELEMSSERTESDSDSPEINYRSGNTSYGSGRRKRDASLSSYSYSAHSGSRISSSSQAESGRARKSGSPNTRPNYQRKRPLKSSAGIRARQDSNVTTTTAAPPPAEETFFASYGGDIEYFFPLISFGIPFDGEITFLGFHGFKGLFPYR